MNQADCKRLKNGRKIITDEWLDWLDDIIDDFFRLEESNYQIKEKFLDELCIVVALFNECFSIIPCIWRSHEQT